MKNFIKKYLRVFLIGVLLLVTIGFSNPNLFHFKQEVKEIKKSTYKGYGSKTLRVLENHNLHPYEICILLGETGGVLPKNNNLGNLRNKDLTYRSYTSVNQGIVMFKQVMQKKYHQYFTDDPHLTFKTIQPIYAPDNKKWSDNCMIWYNLIYKK